MGLPLCALVAWWLFWWRKAGVDGKREALLRAFITWAALAMMISEVLSWFHAIHLPSLVCAWVISTIAPLAITWCTGMNPKLWVRPTAVGWVCLTVVGIFALVTLLVGLVAPPMTFDSMTYHLARVAHWRANGSIDHYPTHILRQLMFGNCAEVLILQFHVLGAGSDTMANLVQWLAWVGCIAAGSLLVRELGGDRLAQCFGAAFVGTAPMLLLQASSTQNDLVCACFLVAFVWFGLRALREPRTDLVWMAGLSLALAIATKGTAYVFGAPFAMAGFAALWRLQGWRASVRQALIVSICIVAFNGPLWVRNVQTFNYPLGDSQLLRSVNNDSLSWRPLVSNGLRNAALHVGALSGSWASRSQRAVVAVHGWLGLDPEDPGTTFRGERFQVLSFVPHEDFHGNPLHAGMILAGLAAVTAGAIRRSTDSRLIAVSLCWMSAALLFLLLLKWQPWHSRLHTPLLVLGVVPVTAALAHRRWFRLEPVLAAILFVAALPAIWRTEGRPFPSALQALVSPGAHISFIARPDLHASYQTALAEIGSRQQPVVVGLIMNEESWEYPLWQVARDEYPGMTFKHVAVRNASTAPVPQVTALILIDQPDSITPESLGMNGWKLHRADAFLRLYLPER